MIRTIDWANDGVESFLKQLVSVTAKKKLLKTLTQSGAKKVVITALVETTLKQLYSTLAHSVLDGTETVIWVLHVQTVWLLWLKLFKTTGVVEGLMTTIHAYTGDQMILDETHTVVVTFVVLVVRNIVPNSTGAASYRSYVPELNRTNLTDRATRSNSTGSVTELVAVLERTLLLMK